MTAPAKQIVGTRELETAEDLFRELSPATGDLWRVNDQLDDNGGHWLFRGSANGADGKHWDLRPSAHRGPESFLSLLEAQVTPYQLAGFALRMEELRHVFNFGQVVDGQGVIVPSDSHEFRDGRRPSSMPWEDPTLFPPPNLVAMVALAQHHGIPTRLLDWTWKPLVAAYFAAQPVACRRAPGMRPPDTECPYFSIFAVRRFVADACKTFDPEIHFLTVPAAANARLHAQGGMFSLVQPLSDLGDTDLPAIDQVLIKHADRIWEGSRWQRLFPLLVEFRIPVREARTVMLTLRYMNVSAASVYPGFDGAVMAMKEVRLYQRAKPGERS